MQVKHNSIVAGVNNRLTRFVNGMLQSPQANARLAMLMNIALVTSIAYSAANLTWQMFQAQSEPQDVTPVLTNTRPAAKKATSATLTNIPALHLFGVAASNAEQTKRSGPISAPETRLRLDLHGVFASDDPAQSLAIIAEKGGKDKAYRINDPLPGGAVLHEVYKDRVILSRNGKLETLRMKLDRANIKIETQTTNNLSGARGPAHSSPRIKHLRTMYKKDPQKLWQQIRISPVMTDGRIQGYQFTHNDRLLMQDLGLRPQDVITEINGMPVTDTASVIGMMKDIDRLTEVNLTVRRNGKREDLFIRLD